MANQFLRGILIKGCHAQTLFGRGRKHPDRVARSNDRVARSNDRVARSNFVWACLYVDICGNAEKSRESLSGVHLGNGRGLLDCELLFSGVHLGLKTIYDG